MEGRDAADAEVLEYMEAGGPGKYLLSWLQMQIALVGDLKAVIAACERPGMQNTICNLKPTVVTMDVGYNNLMSRSEVIAHLFKESSTKTIKELNTDVAAIASLQAYSAQCVAKMIHVEAYLGALLDWNPMTNHYSL